MSLRFLTEHKTLASQGFFLFAFCAAFAAFTLFVIFRPAGGVEGRPQLQSYTKPEVGLDRNFTPRSVSEGDTVEVKVKLYEPFDDDDVADKNMPGTYPQGKPICRKNNGVDDDNAINDDIEDDETPCIEGGIIVWDDFNDSDERKFADALIAFVFRQPTSEEVDREQILRFHVCDDGRVDSQREIRIEINTAFEDASHPQRPPPETYGYTIDHYTIRVRVNDSGSLVPTCEGVRGVIVEPMDVSITEGETGTYSVELTHPP